MNQPRKLKAIGYDVDGTLVNSEPLHVSAWQEALRQQQRTFSNLPAGFQRTMAGRKPIDIATFMVQQLNIDKEPVAFLTAKQAIFMAHARTSLQPMPGAVASIKRFAPHYALGIGTSQDRAYIDVVLERLDVSAYFTVIVTGDGIAHGKPDPETYLTLAAQMGIDPSAMVVFEDAASGIVSAKAAGCSCIAIYNPHAVKQDTSAADYTVESLDQITDTLLSRLLPA